MKLQEYLLFLEKFLKDYLDNSHMDTYVLGLSGGVDSSLVASMTRKAVGKDRLMCIMIPIDSLPADLKDAKEVAKQMDLNYIVIDQSEAYHQIVKSFENNGEKIDRSTGANIKARLRMVTLYAYAQAHRGLVLGTDNACERYTGYFTKYGDGAADVLPIVHLLKREVVEACKLYGLSSVLAERVPSAGLFEGQTDESEMGVTYKEIDDFLLGLEINPKTRERIEHLHRISEHKRKDIPTPKPFERD